MGADGRGAFKGRSLPAARVGAGSGHGPFKAGSGHVGQGSSAAGLPPGRRQGRSAREGSNGPRRGARDRAAGRRRPDTHRGSPGAPAPAPALGSRGGGGGESGAGKQAPPSLTYFLPSLNVAPLTYFPTNPLPAGPGPAPRPPIAVPNPPSPPTNGGAAEPGYLPLPASQSERPKGAGPGGRHQPIRARLGSPLASCVAAREAADQWRGGGGRFTCYFPATNHLAHRSARPEEKTNLRALPGFPRPCPLPFPSGLPLTAATAVPTPRSSGSPGMSLFSRSPAGWRLAVCPHPSSFSSTRGIATKSSSS